MSESFISNKYYDLFIQDGIIINVYKDNLELDLKIAKQITRERLEMTKGRAFPSIIDARKLKSADREVRQFWSSPEGIELVKAGAIVVNNPVQKAMVNFFLLINKPALPSRFFTNMKDAFLWVEKYK